MKTEHVMTLEQAQGGFAPAAAPVAASAIITDEQGIHAGQTTIPSQGDALPAYVAKPADHNGPFPIVLVVQEIFGVHEHIQDLCRRLAKQGYLAIAPELYFRQGDANDYTDIGELFQQLVTKVPDRQVLSDLDHAAHWAIRHGGDANQEHHGPGGEQETHEPNQQAHYRSVPAPAPRPPARTAAEEDFASSTSNGCVIGLAISASTRTAGRRRCGTSTPIIQSRKGAGSSR